MRRRPSRATVALIAGNAGPGITDTWTPATTPEAPRDEDPLADAGQPADEAAGDQGRRIRSTCPRHPARRAARPGRGAPAQVPRHRLHPAPGRQGADPVRPARSPTPSTSWSASAPPRWSPTSPAPTGSPPPPRHPPQTRPATPPPARRLRPAPRNAARTNGAAGTATSRPGRAVCRSYLPYCRARPTCHAPGATPYPHAGRRPLPARYIRALTGVVSRRYTASTREVHEGPSEVTGPPATTADEQQASLHLTLTRSSTPLRPRPSPGPFGSADHQSTDWSATCCRNRDAPGGR